VATKKRNLYNKQRLKEPQDIKAAYILRWIDPENNEINNNGPYSSESKAIAEQNAKLLKGICSWLVVYNGK